MIAAVGNDGTSVLNYPAAYTGVIGVGSVDSTLKRSSFSQRNSSVYVTAPGQDVCSLNAATKRYRYISGSGTSFAAPLVTGMARLWHWDMTATLRRRASAIYLGDINGQGQPWI